MTPRLDRQREVRTPRLPTGLLWVILAFPGTLSAEPPAIAPVGDGLPAAGASLAAPLPVSGQDHSDKPPPEEPEPPPPLFLIINGQTVVEDGPVIVIPADRSRAAESGDDQNAPHATTRAATVQILYTLNGVQGQELFLIADAPPINIFWSYLNAAGQWIPLPADFSKITPFVVSALADGTYPLFNGVLPAGRYELYLAVDYAKNGHLDITAGNLSLNGYSIHAVFQVL